jgi:uncharacterized protein (TIGR02246 family)
VEHDIGWLLDRTQIRELTARYGRCFDEGDAEGYALTFTEDGSMEIVGGPVTSGREALTAMCRSVPWGTMHVTVDPTVTVDGDTAQQIVTILVVARPKTRSEQPKIVGSGHYVDDLVRTPEGWLFKKRSVTLDGWGKE